METLSASAALQLPVRLHDITLGHPTDLLVNTESWQVLGFVVHCGDESTRFLPYGASQVAAGEIAVASALILLEDTECESLVASGQGKIRVKGTGASPGGIIVDSSATTSCNGNKRAIETLARFARLTPEQEAELVELRRSCFASEDFREGIRAFAERRKPHWRGR